MMRLFNAMMRWIGGGGHLRASSPYSLPAPCRTANLPATACCCIWAQSCWRTLHPDRPSAHGRWFFHPLSNAAFICTNRRRCTACTACCCRARTPRRFHCSSCSPRAARRLSLWLCVAANRRLTNFAPPAAHVVGALWRLMLQLACTLMQGTQSVVSCCGFVFCCLVSPLTYHPCNTPLVGSSRH